MHLYWLHTEIQSKSFYHDLIPLNEANGITASDEDGHFVEKTTTGSALQAIPPYGIRAISE